MQKSLRYALDNRPGKKKYQCPQCGSFKRLTRYIDLSTYEEISDIVGICDRIDNCGYHYTPGQYFKDNPGSHREVKFNQIKFEKNEPISFIEHSIFQKTISLSHYAQNSYFQYLTKCFDQDFALNLCRRYMIGNSNRWAGAAIFWLVDIDWRIRSGKIMPINCETGKRLHAPIVDSNLDWVHSRLLRDKKIDKFNLVQCFFGEHLLKYEINQPVAIVEGEKTAVICSVYLPEYVWIAAGNIHGLNNFKKCEVLMGREVVLFPDLGKGYEVWLQKAKILRNELGLNIRVSDILERIIIDKNEKAMGYDLEDYLLKTDSNGHAIKDGKKIIELIPEWENYEARFK